MRRSGPSLLLAGLAFLAGFSAVAGPPDLGATLRGAVRDLNAGRYRSATESFRVVVEVDPSNVSAHEGLVRSLLNARDLDGALQAAQHATVDVPESAALTTLVADVRFRRAEFDQARDGYRRALTLGPAPRAWLGLGRIDETRGEHLSARLHFRRARDLDPGDPNIALKWFGSLENLEQRDAAARNGSSRLASEHPVTVAELQDWMDRPPAARRPRPFRPDRRDRAHVVPLSLVQKKRQQGIRVRGLAVEVSFNDRPPRLLLLDTGASGVVLRQKATRRTGIELFGPADVSGVGSGPAPKARWGTFRTMKVGELSFADVPVRVTSRSLVPGVDGVIGADVFRDFLIRVDPFRRVLELSPHGPSGDADHPWLDEATPVRMISDRLLIQARVNDAPAGYFLIDSGAPGNLFSPSLGRRGATMNRSEGAVLGLSGPVDLVYRTTMLELEVGGVSQLNHNALSIEMDALSESLGTSISGIIGNTLLSQVALVIDYRGAQIRLEPEGESNLDPPPPLRIDQP